MEHNQGMKRREINNNESLKVNIPSKFPTRKGDVSSRENNQKNPKDTINLKPISGFTHPSRYYSDWHFIFKHSLFEEGRPTTWIQ